MIHCCVCRYHSLSIFTLSLSVFIVSIAYPSRFGSFRCFGPFWGVFIFKIFYDRFDYRARWSALIIYFFFAIGLSLSDCIRWANPTQLDLTGAARIGNDVRSSCFCARVCGPSNQSDIFTGVTASYVSISSRHPDTCAHVSAAVVVVVRRVV